MSVAVRTVGLLCAGCLIAPFALQGERNASASPPAPLSLAAPQGEPPQIDVDRIRWVDSAAEAPVVGGGIAALTLDRELTTTASRLLHDARPIAGTVIVTEVKSGRILVWESFRRSGSARSVALDLAPTASLFKLATTTALYERAGLSPKSRFCFDGGESEVQRKHLEPPPPTRGICAPFSEALGYSRNAVYAQLATHRMTRQDLEVVATRMGFNGDVPFDTPARFGTLRLPYGDLDFARAATGFQGSNITPLGAHWLSYAIATEGVAPRLTMIKSAGNYHSPRRRVLTQRLLDATTAYRLVRAMEVTVNSGTSLEAFTAPNGASYLGNIHVAGKTGTLKPSPDAPTTSWFTGFAPSRAPRIVVTVLLQNSDVWRRKGNEVARDVLRAYFAGSPGVTHPFTGE